MTDNNRFCPECGYHLTKAGGAWSGRTRCQQFRCLRCGRATIRPFDAQGNRVEAQPYIKETECK